MPNDDFNLDSESFKQGLEADLIPEKPAKFDRRAYNLGLNIYHLTQDFHLISKTQTDYIGFSLGIMPSKIPESTKEFIRNGGMNVSDVYSKLRGAIQSLPSELRGFTQSLETKTKDAYEDFSNSLKRVLEDEYK
jgi:hypothetical protein